MRASLGVSLALVGIVLIVGYAFFSSLSDVSFAGRAVDQKEPPKLPSDSASSDVDGVDGADGSSDDAEITKVITKDTDKADYSDSSVSVAIAGKTSGVSETNPILVSQPSAKDVVAGQPARWKMRVDIPQGGEVDELTLTLPSGASYVKVEGEVPLQVSVRPGKVSTSVFSSLTDFFLGIKSGGSAPIAVSVKGASEQSSSVTGGAYSVSYSTTSPSIVQESFTSRGAKRVVVSNPSNNEYSDVLVATRLPGRIEPGAVKVVSASGKSYTPLVHYLPDEDITIVDFKSDFKGGEKQSFDVSVTTLDVSKLSDIFEDSEIFASPEVIIKSLSDLPAECIEGLSCEVTVPCRAPSTAQDSFDKSVALTGTRDLLCTHTDSTCPPLVKVVEPCTLSRTVNVDSSVDVQVQIANVFLSPEQDAYIPSILLRDSETQRPVAVVRSDFEMLDVVFLQGLPSSEEIADRVERPFYGFVVSWGVFFILLAVVGSFFIVEHRLRNI